MHVAIALWPLRTAVDRPETGTVVVVCGQIRGRNSAISMILNNTSRRSRGRWRWWTFVGVSHIPWCFLGPCRPIWASSSRRSRETTIATQLYRRIVNYCKVGYEREGYRTNYSDGQNGACSQELCVPLVMTSQMSHRCGASIIVSTRA